MIAIEETATVQPNGRIVVHRPELKPGSQVKVILLVEETPSPVAPPPPGQPGSFFEVVGSLNLDGPSDWSAHLDEYLYHGKSHDRQ